MSKLNIFILTIVLLLFTACSEKQERNVESEKYFIHQVEKLLKKSDKKKSDKIESDFTNLVPFEWEKVCFDDALFMRLTFINKKTKNFLDLSEKFAIDEGYMKGSPVKEMYINHKVINHNCWEKGTIFFISAFKNINNKYKVRL